MEVNLRSKIMVLPILFTGLPHPGKVLYFFCCLVKSLNFVLSSGKSLNFVLSAGQY